MAFSFSVFLRDFVSRPSQTIQSNVGRVAQSISNVQTRLQRFSSLTGRSLDSLARKLELQRAARGAARTIGEIMRLNNAIRQTERQIQRLENLPPPSFVQRLRSAASGFRDLIGLAGGLAIAMAAINGITGIAKLGMDAQDTRIKFEVMLGSAGKARSMLEDITQYANTTPFGSTELKQSAELLLNFGIAGQKIMPTLKMLGDVSGGNKDRLNGMTLAFAQMSSTGRLMGQDLNQMINAGFNPLQVISQNTGISLGKLKEQMEAGMISVGMIEEAFKLATGPGGRFFGMIDKVSQSASGRMATAMDNIQTKLTIFSENNIVPVIARLATIADVFFGSLDSMAAVMQPFFDTLKPLWDAIVAFTASFFGLDQATSGTAGVINFLTKTLQFLQPVLTVISNGLRAAIEILTPFAPILKVLTILWAGWNLLLVIFNALIFANPIGLIVAGIILLIGVIVTCWQKFDAFRGVVMGAWEAIKGFGVMIKNYVINRFKELLSGIVGIGQALMHFFKGDFGKAWEVGKKAAGDLLGVGSASKLIEDGKKVAGKVGAAYNAEFVKKQTPEIVKGGQKTKATADVVQSQKRSTAFDLLGDGSAKKDKDGKSGKGGSKRSSDAIIGGGSKITHITINVAKMQDQIVINTINTGDGATKMRQILEEELNRLLGSVASMQAT